METNETVETSESIESEQSEENSKKKPNIFRRLVDKYGKKKCIAALLIVLGVLVAIYVIIAIVFQSRFLPDSVINGINCGGKTVKQAQELFEQEADNYVLTLKERGDEEETIAGTDIGLEVSFDDELETLMKEQNGFAWIAHLFGKDTIELQQMITYDASSLDKQLESLDCMDESKMIQSSNATLSDYNEDTGYELVDAVYGTTINEDNFTAKLDDAITNLTEELDLSESGCYDDPQYTEDSDEAKAMVETANQYVGTTINYEFGSSTKTIDGTTISGWITVGDDMSVTLDDTKVSDYVSGLASTYNTAGKSKSLATTYGATVTVSGGNYGWKIDQDATKEALVASIESGEDYTGDVEYSQTANSHDGNDYGNTYVEINLTAQHLYFYKNGSLVVESDFVSGNVAKGYNTPTGAYRVTYTEKDATLNGENYSTPVSYWMPFAGNVGMHDATWRSSFGGATYLYSGSHGCVNLPYSAAQAIFNNIKTGDPVLVYTLSGTENSGVIAYNNAQTVKNAISAIGTVTLDSAGTISSARTQYDSLTDEGKAFVSNYDVLTAAEASYATLQQQAADAAAAAAAAADAATQQTTDTTTVTQ